MKIIHIVNGNGNPNKMDGVTKVVHHLANSQHNQGFDVEVWGISNQLITEDSTRDYKLKLYHKNRIHFLLSKSLKEALNNLDRNTWVQLHSVYIPEYGAISNILKKGCIQFGITPHGGYHRKKSLWNTIIKNIYIQHIESKIIKNSSFIQIIGEIEIPFFNKYKSIQLEHIPNGFDLKTRDKIMTLIKKDRPNDNTELIFGYCGRLDARFKGLDLLLESFDLYKKQGGKGSLWIIGDGPDKKNLVEFARNKISNNAITFFGAKYDIEKYTLLTKIDIFVHTSRSDVMPTACLEAAALGIPLLVSKETCLFSYVENSNSGWGIINNEISNIVEKMFQIENEFKNTLFLYKKENAYKLVEEKLNWDKISKDFSDIVFSYYTKN